MTGIEEQVTRAFEESRDDVYRYVLTLGLPPPQAQEVTQEVFLRLYLALQRGDAIQNLRAWVFRVAHNHGLDVRAKERLSPLEPELQAMLSDDRRGVDADLIERDRMGRLASAWSKLSLKQRQCLHLRAEGLRYREIAEVMQISISSVREFLDRAIGKLQKTVL
jgi:RNA polymerase sigma-70 factor (ECF subfamily)